MTIALVGNPNSGKTTLFNALTGAKQKVGNWPGVTVARKSGVFHYRNQAIDVVDLPGTYSLTMLNEAAIDERIANEYILSREADVIINVIDASNLERNLYLTTQLLEMRVPVIVALNMMDVLKQRGIEINVKALASRLGCQVIPIIANKKHGLAELKNTIQAVRNTPTVSMQTVTYPDEIKAAVKILSDTISMHKPQYQPIAACLATRLLEDDHYAAQVVGDICCHQVPFLKKSIEEAEQEEADIIIADARYGFVHAIIGEVIKRVDKTRRTITSRLDRIVLNRWLGIPIFLAVMYSMFFFAINLAGVFQDFFDITTDTLFVQGVAHLLQAVHSPVWLTALLASGVGKGINTTLTFVPVIGGMFLFLSFLEASGYMARAAFVMDRLMRALGLPGKSFVPMIVGFGCNVPAIMGARTLENKRDRILTIMMSPFMSCGARLAIYAVFTAAFFPAGGQNIVFLLYVIGIVIAVLTGFILRKTVLNGEPSQLIMELPSYHIPTASALLLNTWQRLQMFLLRASKVIIPVCMLIGALNAFTIHGGLSVDDAHQDSLLSIVGQTITPIFAPMGIRNENWPATVGLLTGVLAKEVVVATLNTLYSQVGHIAFSTTTFDFWGGMQAAWMSIPDNLANLGDALKNPVLASAPDQALNHAVYGLMYQRFNGQVGAFAYLLFVLLYFPCISATAAMQRELSKGWTLFSVCWTTGLAYAVATTFYQLATLTLHPAFSLCWSLGVAMIFFIVVAWMRYYAFSAGGKTYVTVRS